MITLKCFKAASSVTVWPICLAWSVQRTSVPLSMITLKRFKAASSARSQAYKLAVAGLGWPADCNWHFLHRSFVWDCNEMYRNDWIPPHSITTVAALPWPRTLVWDHHLLIILIWWFMSEKSRHLLTDAIPAIKILPGDNVSVTWSARYLMSPVSVHHDSCQSEASIQVSWSLWTDQRTVSAPSWI